MDFGRLDAEVDKVVWTLTNLFPHCLMMSIDGIRAKKKFFWDQFKLPNRHWLAANMMSEAYPGFKAFNTKNTPAGTGSISPPNGTCLPRPILSTGNWPTRYCRPERNRRGKVFSAGGGRDELHPAQGRVVS